MRVRAVVLASLVTLLAGLAIVVGRSGRPDPLAPESLKALLAEPPDPPPGAPPVAGATWEKFLDTFAEHTDAGLRIRLGHVLADPTAARASAEHAGELLALEAEGAEGKLGQPLWRVIVAGLDAQPGAERTLDLHGCRHSALPEDGPVIEDTYVARLSLARALRELAAGERPLVVRGEDTPVAGGVNFEVLYMHGVQSVSVSFDKSPTAPLRASRPYHPETPNDARAREALVQALREHAAAAGLGTLAIEPPETPSAGVDVRIEEFGDRLSLVACRGSQRLATHRVLRPDATREP